MWSESKGLLVYLLNTGWIGYRFKKMDFTLYLLAIWTQVIIGYYIQTNGYHQVDDNCTISSSQSQPSQTQKDNLYICRFWYHLLGCKDDWVSSFLARQMGITRQKKNCTISHSDSAQVSLQLRSDSDAVAIVSLSLVVLSLICLYL